MTAVTRRTALLSGTAAVAVVAIPATVQARSSNSDLNDQGLLGLERQWLAHQGICLEWAPEHGEVYEALYARLDEMEECIYCNPAQTLAGVMVKLRMWCWNCTNISDPHPYGKPWWRGDLAAMCADEMGFSQIMRDLERLARRAES